MANRKGGYFVHNGTVYERQYRPLDDAWTIYDENGAGVDYSTNKEVYDAAGSVADENVYEYPYQAQQTLPKAPADSDEEISINLHPKGLVAALDPSTLEGIITNAKIKSLPSERASKGIFGDEMQPYQTRKDWVAEHQDYLKAKNANIDWENYRGTKEQNLALKKLLGGYDSWKAEQDAAAPAEEAGAQPAETTVTPTGLTNKDLMEYNALYHRDPSAALKWQKEHNMSGADFSRAVRLDMALAANQAALDKALTYNGVKYANAEEYNKAVDAKYKLDLDLEAGRDWIAARKQFGLRDVDMDQRTERGANIARTFYDTNKYLEMNPNLTYADIMSQYKARKTPVSWADYKKNIGDVRKGFEELGVQQPTYKEYMDYRRDIRNFNRRQRQGSYVISQLYKKNPNLLINNTVKDAYYNAPVNPYTIDENATTFNY